MLTNQPPKEMGVATNRLQAGKEFAFPSGDWLGLSEPTADFELIFSPVPLTQSAFLSANDVRQLTADELRFLDGLRRQSAARDPKAETSADNGIIRASVAGKTPIVVTITVRRKAKPLG